MERTLFAALPNGTFPSVRTVVPFFPRSASEREKPYYSPSLSFRGPP